MANATANRNEEQIVCIVKAGAIAPLCKLLSDTDVDLIEKALICLANIIRAGESMAKTAGSTVNPFATLICNSPSMRQALYSEKTTIQLDATKRFRNLLGISERLNLLIDELVKSGTVPRFVHFLEATRYPELQFESALVLINITHANSAQTQAVIDSGAVPVLIRLITTSQDIVIVEYSVWVLGNIAAASAECRDLLLNSNVLPPLLGLFNSGILNKSFLGTATRTTTCTLRNLCCGPNPPPNFEQVSQCLPVLSRLIDSQDNDILVHVCWALANLSEGPTEQIQVVIDSGVCPRAVQLLSHTSSEVVSVALNLVGTITSGDASQIQLIINENALPALGSLLSHENDSILENACLTLANITITGNEQQVQAVIDCNIIRSLIDLLQHRDVKIRRQVVRALGNIACHSRECRDFLLNSNVLQPLLGLFNDDNASLSMMRMATWTLRKLCDKKPFPSFEQVSQCLPLLARLMVNEDEEILSEACLALTGLCDGSNEQIQAVIDSGVLPRVVQLLGHSSTDVVEAALDLVDNIVMGDDSQTQVLINENALPALGRLLSHEMASIVEDACWTLGNIAVGTDQQIQSLIDANIIPSLIELLHHQDIDIRKSAILAIANATANGSEEQIVNMVEAGTIPPLCQLLSETDSDLIEDALRGIENILCTGESVASAADSTVNPFATIICNVPSMKLALYSEKTAIQLDATKRFRNILEKMGGFDFIDELIKSGTVPRFVHFLEDSRYPELQHESVCVLTSIACGNSAQTQVVINAGAVPVLIKLLSSSHENVVEQSVWALGNIVFDSTECRDLVLNSNVVPPLLGLFNDDNVSLSMMRIATQTLRNLCHQIPLANFAQVSQCLPLLARLMVKEDEEVLVNVCQALAHINTNEGSNEKLQAIIESGVCPRAVQLLSHSSTDVVDAALRLVCTITTGDVSHFQVLINGNALPALGNLLSHEKELIVENSCLTLANITVHSEKQIQRVQAVIDANILPSLIELLHHGDIKIRKGAARALSNVATSRSEAQIGHIVEAGAIAPLCKLLSDTDLTLLKKALNGLENILFSRNGISTENTYATFIVDSGVCPRAVQLLGHSSNEVVNDAISLVCNLVSGHTGRHNQVIINAHALPALGSLLSHEMELIVQYACVTLFHITVQREQQIQQVQAVIDANIIPSLIGLLHHGDIRIRKGAARALSNATASRSEEQIVYIVEAGAIPPLCQLLSETDSDLIENAVSGLANILHTGESVAKDETALTNACLEFRYEGSNEQIQVIIDSAVCLRAVQLLSHNSTSLVKAALRLVGNIAAGDDSHTQVLINANALPALGRLLSHEREYIVEYACWTLSNITIRNEQQIQAVIDCNILPSLIELLHHGDVKIRKEAARALSNATFTTRANQIVYIVEAGAILPLCQLLSETDSDLIDDVLIGLENILLTGKEISNAAGSTVNAYATFVIQFGGLDKMTFLSSHANVMIAQKASTLIEMYFDLEVDSSSEKDSFDIDSRDEFPCLT